MTDRELELDAAIPQQPAYCMEVIWMDSVEGLLYLLAMCERSYNAVRHISFNIHVFYP